DEVAGRQRLPPSKPPLPSVLSRLTPSKPPLPFVLSRLTPSTPPLPFVLSALTPSTPPLPFVLSALTPSSAAAGSLSLTPCWRSGGSPSTSGASRRSSRSR